MQGGNPITPALISLPGNLLQKLTTAKLSPNDSFAIASNSVLRKEEAHIRKIRMCAICSYTKIEGLCYPTV
ncbi:hypothetical protein, partial [Parabacteroides sp. PF5-6]|uniref:hypothetical protein n=1 Tax=Parabacteroides sp. PF5-6 TaxID=1742403 RepID=UPI002406437A